MGSGPVVKSWIERLPNPAVPLIIGVLLILVGGFMLLGGRQHADSLRAYERCVAEPTRSCSLADGGSQAGSSTAAYRRNYENQFRVGGSLVGVGAAAIVLGVACARIRKRGPKRTSSAVSSPPAAVVRRPTGTDRRHVAVPTRDPRVGMTPPDEHVADPDYVEINRMASNGYMFGDGQFEAVGWRRRHAFCIVSGDQVGYGDEPAGAGWLINGRGANDEIALVCVRGPVRYASVDLRTLLVTNPQLLEGQAVEHAGTEWRVRNSKASIVTLVRDDRSVDVDAETLVEKNLAELRGQAVLLVDVG